MPEPRQTPNSKFRSVVLLRRRWKTSAFDLWIFNAGSYFPALMPIYEFHCGDCQSDSEVLVRSANWQGTKCPRCGSVKLEKKLSVFASSATNAEGSASCSGVPSS